MANRTASAHIRARSSGSRCGAGAISTTFWCRRCTEQSRSKRWMTLPSPSARICTSMWRGSTTACSMKTVGSPKAPSASRMHVSTASRSSLGSSTRLMPRPPPPATALTNSGYGSSFAASTSVSRSVPGSTLLRVGTPAALAAAIARALLPVSVSTSLVGPMKVMPAFVHASASAGFCSGSRSRGRPRRRPRARPPPRSRRGRGRRAPGGRAHRSRRPRRPSAGARTTGPRGERPPPSGHPARRRRGTPGSRSPAVATSTFENMF